MTWNSTATRRGMGMRECDSIGYGFAYARWMQLMLASGEWPFFCGCETCIRNCLLDWTAMQEFPLKAFPEPGNDGTPTTVDYDNDCAP